MNCLYDAEIPGWEPKLKSASNGIQTRIIDKCQETGCVT